VIVYARQDAAGQWVIGNKRWIPSSKDARRALIIRAESVHAADWPGVEVDLYTDVVKSPHGGWTWGVRVRPTAEERNDSTLREKMRRAAERLPPNQRTSNATQRSRERQPGEDEPTRGDETRVPDGAQTEDTESTPAEELPLF